MGQTAVYGFRYPELGNSADGPAGFKNLAEDVEAVLASSALQVYTPAWTSLNLNGNIQPINAATRVGRYSVDRGVCFVQAEITFNSSTQGGRGNLGVSLPVAPRSGITAQMIDCNTRVPGLGTELFFGNALLYPGTTVAQPTFLTPSGSAGWISANAAGAGGTGVPLMPAGTLGGSPIQPGGYFIMQGSYFV